jgi:iron complex outermembrane recepter protein
MRMRLRINPSAGRTAPTVDKSGIRQVLRRGYVGLGVAVLLAIPACSQETPKELGNKSIEDLMNIEVTSVSKKEEKLSRTASAVFVITQQDIRRSGATNIPDLLRMVPGLDVAQVNSSTWAISSRGFNDEVANKLLVLIDGRTVYSPLFGGVFWDVQQIPLEIIDRIEVIRGPGAAVWGANAVNGVINIITKKASDTQGTLVSIGGGTYEQGFGTAMFGGRLGGNQTYYRAFMNAFNRNHMIGLDGRNGQDDWDAYRTGFRLDTKFSAKDSVTFQGDAYEGSEGEVVAAVTSFQPPQPQTLDLRQDLGGWDLLSRWDRTISPTSQTTLQIYFDRTNRGDPTYGEGRNTFDVDFQHHIAWGDRQDFVWGLGYRATSDDIRGSIRVSFNPQSETDQLFSSFVQDEIAIIPKSLYFTIGAKLEHNHFTGFGLQPDARIAWLVNDRNMLWASVSRAMHTPARDSAVRFNQMVSPGPNGVPVVVSVFGVDDENENMLAEEIGYRTQMSEHLSLDLAAYHNSYTDLSSEELGTPFLEFSPAPTHLVLPLNGANLLHGEGHGTEMSLNWKPASRWTLSPGYSYLQLHIHRDPASTAVSTPATIEGSSPREQAQLRSHLELTPRWAWDASAYFVGRLPALGIPSYTRVDTGLTWNIGEKLSLSLVGQNLLHDHHLESNRADQTVLSSFVKRSAYAKLTWQF